MNPETCLPNAAQPEGMKDIWLVGACAGRAAMLEGEGRERRGMACRWKPLRVLGQRRRSGAVERVGIAFSAAEAGM